MKNKLKNTLIKLFLTFPLVMGMYQIQAQDNTEQPVRHMPLLSAEERTDRIISDFKNKLTLTEGQAQSMHDLILAREKLRDAKAGDMNDERKKFNDALKDILSADQLTAFYKLQEERKARIQERRKQMHQE